MIMTYMAALCLIVYKVRCHASLKQPNIGKLDGMYDSEAVMDLHVACRLLCELSSSYAVLDTVILHTLDTRAARATAWVSVQSSAGIVVLKLLHARCNAGPKSDTSVCLQAVTCVDDA